MWYDLLVLAILGYFTLRGAARGLLSQLAGIAAIIVCLVFAESISAAFGPLVSLQPPLNHWVVMFGAYLVCSFITFGLARVMDDWLERAKLESFNSHLGALFGLLKGGIVCLVMTFFLVTLSPAAREALSQSKSGYVAARIMHGIHPVMPQKIKEALAKYLHISATGESEVLPLPTGPAGPTLTDGTTPVSPFPGAPPTPSGANPWTSDPFAPVQPQQAPTPVAGTRQAIDLFVANLPSTVGNDLRGLIGQALANTPPEQWAAAQQQLWNMLRQTRPEDLRDLQSQLARNQRQTLSQAISGWMGGFVAPGTTAPQPGYPPAAVPTPGGSLYPATPSPGFVAPSYPSWTPPATPAPQQPAPLVTAQQSAQEALLVEISRAFSSIPPVQLQMQADIRQRLTGLPPGVGESVLEDWRRDLWQKNSPDPDPGTDANATLETRIVRQLQSRGIQVNRLSSDVQQRLEGATLR